MWGKIYKKQLFNNFRFRKDLKYRWGRMAMWQLSLAASTISFQNKIDYTFRVNKTGKSISNIDKKTLQKKMSYV